ncbi:hypothetical protein D9619_006612 [Psilocybe cf. subviscida]|uniref:Calpain catalytic domain-containing protein n=1 Tax=Psilocybe cf. subviscida TaxID=2480587 RepID=A0A8H5B6H7_9AGAR|nr:hypothetical protein D9619_006612 [Psilocybe cf. subviscida]
MATTVTTTTVETTTPAPTVISFAKEEPGLLVTSGLEKAIRECRARVDRISKECRAQNRKFRDIEFDIEFDRDRCLNGLFTSVSIYTPADVHRVTQIFDDPHFFAASDKANASDIIQGALGDCWFLSALATVSTAPGLIEKFCVARDEKVGVYGFIFFRDDSWDVVIIDDMLYTRVPKYEELKASEQELYHYDKEVYNKSARKGGKSLYFAKSGAAGETWVPLVEKAYAKAHGSYASLAGGQECVAIEDLTGGVSGILNSKDILDPDRFWDEELGRANKDRLFGCSFDSLDSSRNNRPDAMVQGLVGGHAYSVLRAVQCKGRRFVVVRNPWGNSEWTGRWSDGSKEWTQEWLEVLPELGHQFGDDGQFVMEYKDWLDCFAQIDRTILFDSHWMMSSQWLQVTARPLPEAWSYGDVSFRFTLPASSNTVIVLSQMDTRYYDDLKGRSSWSIDFALAKEGENRVLAQSTHTDFYLRSIHLEMELEAGTYTVYVRLDHTLGDIEGKENVDDWKLRKLSRMLTERAKSQSIASNFKAHLHDAYLPERLDDLIQDDYDEFQRRKSEDGEVTVTFVEEVDEDGNVTTTKTTTIVRTEKTVAVGAAKKTPPPPKVEEYDEPALTASSEPTSVVDPPKEKEDALAPAEETMTEPTSPSDTATPAAPNPPELLPPPATHEHERSAARGTKAKPRASGPRGDDYPDYPLPPPPPPLNLSLPPLPRASGNKFEVPRDDPNSVFVGLKVYTHKDVPANIVARLAAPPGPSPPPPPGGMSLPPPPPPPPLSMPLPPLGSVPS